MYNIKIQYFCTLNMHPLTHIAESVCTKNARSASFNTNSIYIFYQHTYKYSMYLNVRMSLHKLCMEMNKWKRNRKTNRWRRVITHTITWNLKMRKKRTFFKGYTYIYKIKIDKKSTIILGQIHTLKGITKQKIVCIIIQ